MPTYLVATASRVSLDDTGAGIGIPCGTDHWLPMTIRSAIAIKKIDRDVGLERARNKKIYNK